MNNERRKIGVEVRNLIVKLQAGKSHGKIVKTFKKCRATIQSIIKKCNKTGNISNNSRFVRSKVLRNRDIRFLIQTVKRDPKKML